MPKRIKVLRETTPIKLATWCSFVARECLSQRMASVTIDHPHWAVIFHLNSCCVPPLPTQNDKGVLIGSSQWEHSTLL